MSRTLVIGDIHGGLLALEQILQSAKVTTSDQLIFLGDYVDGWSQSPQVINHLIQLQKTHQCIFIRGNHDELLLEWFTTNNKNIDEGMWFKHGGKATVDAYEKISQDTINEHINFLKTLQDYYLDSKNRLFLHAGFTNMNGVKSEIFTKMFYWDRTLWETALALDPNIKPESLLYPKRFTLYNEVFIGHTPTTRIEKTVPVQKINIWNVDTGAAFNGPLTIMDINSKEFWQSDLLPKLYPNENGRN